MAQIILYAAGVIILTTIAVVWDAWLTKLAEKENQDDN